MLDLISIFDYSVKLFNLQYKALTASARDEMHNMERIYQARVISRIGFVAQEMKDLQSEVIAAIEQRAVEINNNNAECIVEARRNLNSSVDDAGAIISSAARRTVADLEILLEDIFHPTIGTIDYIVSQFEVEVFMIFAYFNSVTSMFQVIITLESEIRMYGALFEYFVQELYVDMIIFKIYTDLSVEAVFPKLQGGLNTFRDSSNAIRNSLANCS